MLQVKENIVYKYEEVCSQSQLIELIVVVDGITYYNNTCIVSSSLSAVLKFPVLFESGPF